MTTVGSRIETKVVLGTARILGQALAARSKRWYQEARESYERICAEEPHNAVAAHHLGEILMRMGQLGDAAIHLNHAGYLYAGRGEAEKAGAMWRIVLSLHPSHAEARIMLRALEKRAAG